SRLTWQTQARARGSGIWTENPFSLGNVARPTRLFAGRARGLAIARLAGRLTAPGRFGRVLSDHCRRAFALSARADMGLAFGLLLIGLALCFFLLAALEAALTFLRAVKLGRARFVQRDGDGLLPVLHRAGL